MKKKLAMLLLLAILFACDKETNELDPQEPSCVEGTILNRTRHASALINGNLNVSMFDVLLSDHDEYEIIYVPEVDIPDELKVDGTRISFQIDSVGRLGVIQHIIAPPEPILRISNVSQTPCGGGSEL